MIMYLVNFKWINPNDVELNKLKDTFSKIIKDRYFPSHSEREEILSEIDIIDNLIKPVEMKRSELLIRNLITFFDLVIENVQIGFQITKNKFKHSVYIRKLIFGAVKGRNKVKIY